MMAREIAIKLGGGQREGRNYRAPCPIHGGNSLYLADSRDGKLLFHCFGGCEGREVFAELRARGLIVGGLVDISPERVDDLRRREEARDKAEIEKLRRKICGARDLYHRGEPAARTPAETHLRSRGIAGSIPAILRFLELCPHRNGGYYPAMVAPIVNVFGEQIGIHKTFLRPDGTGKADLPKEEQRETCGPFKGGAIRLAPHRAGVELLIIAEGIESTLSAMRLFGLPGWAAICALGIEALELPPEVRAVAIAADHDANMVGQRAALSARERWIADGLSVRILMPPNAGQDFNDILLNRR